MKKSENEKGCDINGGMGQSYDAVYNEAPLLCENESEVGTKLL